VEELAARLGLDFHAQPILACAVTSRQPSGVWPRQQFQRAIQTTRAQVPCRVVYFGAKSDEPVLRQLAQETDAFVIAGDLELPALTAFLRRCKAALTSDSGPRHLANAAGLPVCFVRNLSFRREEAGAYCDTDHDLAPPGLELLAPGEQAAAFAQIDPETVAAELVRLLRR
jgi:ADP-heptose:LPS heptosyltransferase